MGGSRHCYVVRRLAKQCFTDDATHNHPIIRSYDIHEKGALRPIRRHHHPSRLDTANSASPPRPASNATGRDVQPPPCLQPNLEGR
ncbi:hypothetical protein VTO73DRAFT_6740 [Trametes versicolor]